MASRFHSRLRALPNLIHNWATSLGERPYPDNPRRILIAHHLLLGDTLMLTPLLKKLRSQHQGAHIVMATPKAIVPLYSGRPYGIEVYGYDPKDPHSLEKLKHPDGYDLAIVPGDNRYSWLAYAAGARHIVAFAGDRPAYKSWPVDTLIEYPNYPMAWADMVATLVPGEAPLPYSTSEWPTPSASAFKLPNQRYVILHLGASSKLKLWPAEKWQALIKQIEERDLLPIWSAGKNEIGLVTEVDPQHKYPSYAGQLDLAQMWTLLAGADALICPDTGIAHLARIVGTPTVALFGPGSAQLCGKGRFWNNSRFEAVTLADVPCRDQKILFKREISWVQRCGRSNKECSQPSCMQGLQVTMVTSALDSLLKA